MATTRNDQLAMDETLMELPEVADLLEKRHKAKEARNALQTKYKAADDAVKVEIEKLELPEGRAVRIGRWRIARTAVAARAVSFEAAETTRVQISLLDE